MVEFLKDYFAAKGDVATTTQYVDFCDWVHLETELAEDVTSRVFANVELKKALAKKIVDDLIKGEWNNLATRTMDARLRALVKYYLSVALLNNNEMPEEDLRKIIGLYNDDCHSLSYQKGCYLKGWAIHDESGEAIVTMRPGDELYQGYRFFIVNMLCFTANRFVLGFRNDGAAVTHMKYYKGCKPLGVKKASDGKEWSLMKCDYTQSDDHLAIFSNLLDGEGTIEICDWLNDDIQRIIFRCNY